MIYLLHRHPEALARAREEVGGRRIENYEQAATLPFIEACINETMRLKPVAPILILQPARDTVIAGIEVPRRTTLMCLMRAGPTDERRFPEARAFDPGRWLSGASAASPRRVAPGSTSSAWRRPTARRRRSISPSPWRRSVFA
jgi:cytochrome P450